MPSYYSNKDGLVFLSVTILHSCKRIRQLFSCFNKCILMFFSYSGRRFSGSKPRLTRCFSVSSHAAGVILHSPRWLYSPSLLGARNMGITSRRTRSRNLFWSNPVIRIRSSKVNQRRSSILTAWVACITADVIMAANRSSRTITVCFSFVILF